MLHRIKLHLSQLIRRLDLTWAPQQACCKDDPHGVQRPRLGLGLSPSFVHCSLPLLSTCSAALGYRAHTLNPKPTQPWQGARQAKLAAHQEHAACRRWLSELEQSPATSSAALQVARAGGCPCWRFPGGVQGGSARWRACCYPQGAHIRCLQSRPGPGHAHFIP